MPRGKRNNWNGWRIGIEFENGARMRFESDGTPKTPAQVVEGVERSIGYIKRSLAARNGEQGAPHAPTQEKAE